MLVKLKLLLGITDTAEDNLLNLLLELAEQKILDRVYPFAKGDMPERYQPKQVEIAVYLYNKRGAEGQTSHIEGGIHRVYELADVPESLMRGITPFVGAIHEDS